MSGNTRSTHTTTEASPAPNGRLGLPIVVPIRSSSERQVKRADSLCPKCLRTVRQGSESCPKCGLIFALWEKGLARIPGMTADACDDDPRADLLWRRVETSPEDEAAHEAFLTYCRESLRLDLAAARYQAFLFQHPESGLGRTFRERIILLAQFNRPPTQKHRHKLPRFTGLKITLALGSVFLLLGLMMARNLLGR